MSCIKKQDSFFCLTSFWRKGWLEERKSDIIFPCIFFSQLMRISSFIYTHQNKSHLKTALRLKETVLDKLMSWPALNFFLLYSKKKKKQIRHLCTCNYRSLMDKPGACSESVPCWLKLLLGKHAEMRIERKLLFSDATGFKRGTVIFIYLVYIHRKLILYVNTVEGMGRTNQHWLILEK